MTTLKDITIAHNTEVTARVARTMRAGRDVCAATQVVKTRGTMCTRVEQRLVELEYRAIMTRALRRRRSIIAERAHRLVVS